MSESNILPAGKYRARAVDGALGETSTGKEQVAVQFELTDEGFEGQTITWYGYFTEKTLKTTMSALRACGWQGDDLSDLTGIETNEVQLAIEHERDQKTGEPRARVRWVNRAGGLALAAPLAPDRARAFATKMRAYAVQSREAMPPTTPVAVPSGVAAKSAVPPTTPKPTAAPASAPAGGGIPIDEDDIPFALLASLGGALSLFGLVSMVA